MQKETVMNDYKAQKAVIILIILLLILVCIAQAVQSLEIVEKIIELPNLNIPDIDNTQNNNTENNTNSNINYNNEPDYIYIDQVRDQTKDKKQDKSENTDTDTDTNTNTNTNEDNTGFYIEDNNTTWEGKNKLNIFRDITYNNRELIVPFSTGAYDFVLVNANDFEIKVDVNFSHNDPYNINMRYRLKQGNNYIAGDSNTYVTLSELLLQDISMQENAQIRYTLEWRWFESDNDTSIGTLGIVKYELTIGYYAEEII